MKQLYVLFFLICLFTQAAFAQSIEHIKKSSRYYWGEGVGKTAALADKEALSMLAGSISVSIESRFSLHSAQQTHGNKASMKEYVNSIVKTHSNATVKNTEILTWGEEPEVHVFRFVKKTDIDKIFAERERKVREFTEEALRAEEKYRAADALRYYYWALMLLHSLPSAESISMEIVDKEQKLDVFLPRKINEVIGNIAFDVVGRQVDDNITQYLLNITCQGHPAVNCDYSFFDGRNWSSVTGAKDGQGIAELAGDTALHKSLRIKIEYAFENEWKVDNEVFDVLNKVEPVIFKKSYVDIPLKDRRENAPEQRVAVQDRSDRPEEKKPETAVAEELPEDRKAACLSLMERVEKAIRNRDYESVRDCFTNEGYDIFTRLVRYGRGVILSKPAYTFMKFEDGIMVRSLPMRFSFRNNRRVFVENVVFNISQDEDRIRSLSFALPGDVCNSILGQEQWGVYSRLAIIGFIENYQTAYALKRLDYIESIFSDNALIIVGKTVKNYTGTDNGRLALNPDRVKLTRYGKSQYIRQLGAVFKSNEYVNLKFTGINVSKAGKGGEIYGIQLKQDYFSTTYGDTGYLFLMVDLNRTDEPVIHIRTWQPERDPNFGVYDISSF
jgi:hypothetical protein